MAAVAGRLLVGAGAQKNDASGGSVGDPFGTIGPPHNSYLWALAEGGVVVFGLYAWLFVWTIRRIHEIRWEYEARFGPMELGWLVAAMRTALVGFLFYSLFADMWYHDFFYIVMGISLALIHLHEQYASTGKVPERYRIGGSAKPIPLPSAA